MSSENFRAKPISKNRASIEITREILSKKVFILYTGYTHGENKQYMYRNTVSIKLV